MGGDGITLDMVRDFAKKQNKTLYYYNGDKYDASVGKYGVDYVACYPNNEEANKKIDDIASYNKQISKWLNMIYKNEEVKVKTAAAIGGQRTNYSLSAGQNVSYSEEIAYSNNGGQVPVSILGFAVNSADKAEKSAYSNIASSANTIADILFNDVDIIDDKMQFKPNVNLDKQREAAKNDFINSFKKLCASDSIKGLVNETDILTPATKFKIKFNLDPDFSFNDDKEGVKLTTFESGYEMILNDDSYMNVSVCKTPADSLPEYKAIKSAHDFVTNNADISEYLHQYVFIVNGGATRNPWYDADSTLIYRPGTLLGSRTQKIDNPVITLSTTEVSNVPEDEKAIFTIKLTNDSELTGNQTVNHESEFTLSLVDESNDKGAKISIDGMPLTDGRTFTIAPGETINKTVEVLRGDGYDFENLQLELACKDDDKNSSNVTFSVHYLPSSTPIKVSSPSDKWVMNTFSAKDSIGYYMPIVVEGYDINYNNFDHIEIQYKKSTESESSWVNLCSYYADDNLYEAASGNKSKEQIQTGKITHAFYGEKDPIEMKYDIRAVTYCRLGTGFVTKASNIITGTKDTRRPTIFGKSQPINGILTNENCIILPFSEQIAYNYLDETSNFDIRGEINSDDIDVNAGLVFSGEDGQDAYTTVSRNLSNRDFTIDILVQPEEDMKEMTFFSHGNDDDGESFIFGINDHRQLFVNCNGNIIKSLPLKEPVNQAVNHVGVEYALLDKNNFEGKGKIRFFVGNSFIDNEGGSNSECDTYYGNSPIHFGVCTDANLNTAPFKGRMLEARLWNQALSVDMISEYNKKKLDGYSNRIIGYWPMRQTSGRAIDETNGADLTLRGVNWHTSSGHSLIINNKVFDLDGASFQRSADFDYTLTFWMNIEEAPDNAMIFSAGNDSLAEIGMGKLRIGFENGDFIVRSNDNTINVYEQEYIEDIIDHNWHHFALSVSHSKNIANVYMDGYLMEQVQGDKFDGITVNDVCLGSEYLKANIDLLTFWHQALPQDYLKKLMGYRLSGNEMGLYVYLPFDKQQDSSQGTISNRFSAANLAKDNMDIFNKTMVLNVDESTDVDNHHNAPVLDNLPLTKYKYSWSSDGTNLLINLDMKDSEINNRNIYLTVRDVEDVNGNTMANPYSWVIYTDRNILRWETDSKNVLIKQNDTYEGEVTWKNITSVNTNYFIQASSPYIRFDNEIGNAAPNHTNYFTFTIDKGMTPGEYEEYIWLMDEDNDMLSTLTLNITIEADAPEWAVDRTKFDQTMSIVASVKKQIDNHEVLDSDTRDIVGVFVDSECIGVGNIGESKGLAKLFLNVYGNHEIDGRQLTFYLWDYSEGIVTQLTPERDVFFKADSNIGMPPDAPLQLISSETIMQNITLDEGWNWISLNVKPLNSASVNSVFLDNRAFSDGDVIKDNSHHAEYSSVKNTWLADKIDFTYDKVYHVYANSATRINVVGTALTVDQRKLHIRQGWNELPYLFEYNMAINRAMADFQGNDKAEEGDIIKGLDNFAVYSKDYGWIGSLETLQPGCGYYLYHTGGEFDITFDDKGSESDDGYAYAKSRRMPATEHNMIIIATLAEDIDNPDEDAVVEAYSGDQRIGEASPITLPDGTVRYFITVPETSQTVTFVVRDTDSAPIRVGAIPFDGATCIGSLESPYILSARQDSDSAPLYDLSGRRVSDNDHTQGIYVKKGMKILKR